MPYVASPVPALVVAARRRMLSHFRIKGATSEAAAIPFEASRFIERRQFERMSHAGVFRRAANGRYWLDEKRAYEWSTARRKRGLIIAAIAAGAAALFLS